jgi:hypothetical protein
VRTILACTIAAGVACGAALTLPAAGSAEGDPLAAAEEAELLSKIDRWRQRTWYWQRVMGTPRYPTAYLAQTSRSLAYREWVLQLWKSRALRAKQRALDPPHREHWLCIFRHERHPEQGWRTNTGNGYYGGLQMDLSFQRHYGGWLLHRKGRAHRWTPIEQIWAAERGRKLQGWYAWPRSARSCGLI